ncbi:MAG: class II aldolase/adducin family protein [Myxococcota bacterium]|nr:class II aldolase/adducin family protein [Myxococcota bacterium]
MGNAKSSELSLGQAQTSVWESGIRLLKEGFVARTWGNISIRVNETLFVITPSGIGYEALTPEMIVPVAIDDLSYEGTIKPSSEKRLHQAIYRDRQEIRAVVHTHQSAASSVSASRKDIVEVTREASEIIGPYVRTTAYALPGTSRLATLATQAIRGSNAALLAHHGAVCIGRDMDEAFEVCKCLESLCQAFVEKAVEKATGKSPYKSGMVHRTYLDQHGQRH